jgi:hypothetical protein
VRKKLVLALCDCNLSDLDRPAFHFAAPQVFEAEDNHWEAKNEVRQLLNAER